MPQTPPRPFDPTHRRRRASLRQSIPLVRLLLAVTACAHTPPSSAPQVDEAVRVEVTNHYALPVEILAAGSGTTQRLGVVEPGMARRLVVPRAVIGGGVAELTARPTASRLEFRSGQLLLSPGAIVDFEITAQLFNSTATIRP